MQVPGTYLFIGIVCAFAVMQQVNGATKDLVIPLVGWDDTRVPVRNATVRGSENFEFYRRVSWQQSLTAIQMVIDQTNDNPTLLPGYHVSVEQFSTDFEKALGVKQIMNIARQNFSFCMGNYESETLIFSGVAATEFEVAQLSASAPSAALDNTMKYPYVSRMVESSSVHGMVFGDLLHSMAEEGGIGWSDIAILASGEKYGLELANAVIKYVEEDPSLQIATFQQYNEELGSPTVQLNEIKRSGARVILYLAFADLGDLLDAAEEIGIVGPDYVWVVSDYSYAVNFEAVPEATRTVNSRGFLAVAAYVPLSPELIGFLTAWNTANTTQYPGSGPAPENFPTPYTLGSVDMARTAVYAAHALHQEGILPQASAEDWTRAIRQVNFTGISGPVTFGEHGDRQQTFGIYNWITEDVSWHPVSLWTRSGGIQPTNRSIVWPNNSTEMPDLDIRPPFSYWSCHDRKEKVDPTGKTIRLHTPDSDDVDEIRADYHCDQFIDCQNFSDESSGCTSYLGLFIGFGIVSGLLIVLALVLALFVIVFGYVLKYRRVRASSPLFLLLILASIIVGLSSIFAWFGKPHPVACGFQPWLLGLSAISLISALAVRTFRVWRIFRFPMTKVRITDFEMILLWGLLMLPAIVILALWTLISTPTAAMKKLDGEDHYVCTTGGFTGEPGGMIFFFVLVAYGALVLVGGMILSILGRKIPSHFNETRLNTISIYNIALLCAVIIPVFLAVNPYNPLLAWIFRTLSILYVFTATMLLQFAPKLVGVFIIDKAKNPFIKLNTISDRLTKSATTPTEVSDSFSR